MNNNPTFAGITAVDMSAALDSVTTMFDEYATALEDESSAALEDMTETFKRFRKAAVALDSLKGAISKFVEDMTGMSDDLKATADDFGDAYFILEDAMKASGLIEDEQEDKQEEE